MNEKETVPIQYVANIRDVSIRADEAHQTGTGRIGAGECPSRILNERCANDFGCISSPGRNRNNAYQRAVCVRQIARQRLRLPRPLAKSAAPQVDKEHMVRAAQQVEQAERKADLVAPHSVRIRRAVARPHGVPVAVCRCILESTHCRDS